MKNEEKIKKILDDLYKMDPEFKKHKGQLEKIVSELLLLQPNIKPDKKFVEDLRSMLKIESKKNEDLQIQKKTSKNYFFTNEFLIDLSRSFVILSVLLVFIFGFSFVKIQNKSLEIAQNNLQQDQGVNLSSETRIVKLERNSFGSLNFQNQESSSAKAYPSGEMSREESYSQYNLDTTMGVSTTNMMERASIAYPGDVSIMPVVMTRFNYVYVGGDFEPFNSEESVYKRVTSPLPNNAFRELFNADFSIINLARFQDLNISNFTVLEDRDFGYAIHFGLEHGNFSIYKNWQRWPRLETICGSWENYQCFNENRLTIEDVPQDEELIQIASAFLENYGINIDNYGSPVVRNNFLREYNLSSDKASYFIPESIFVVFPLLINGKQVHEQFGDLYGLNVEIDIRHRRVAGLNGLTYQQYQSSLYETETDVNRILELASRGGVDHAYDYSTENVEYETINIELGTPTLGLAKIWHYNDVTMTSQELYVPAYIFPIVSDSGPSYWHRNSVIIPAVRDFFNNQFNVGMPRITPYMDVSVSNQGVSGGGAEPAVIIENVTEGIQ